MKPLPRTHEVKYLDGPRVLHSLAMDLTPLRAIRCKCLDCSNGRRREIELCSVTDCPLWPYRMNRKPTFEGVEVKRRPITTEQLAALKRGRDRQANRGAQGPDV